MLKKTVILLITLSASFSSHGIIIRDDRTYSDHSVLANLSEVGSVLRVRARFGDDAQNIRTYTASAVYIGYGFFLTAGHVVYGDGRNLSTLDILTRSGVTLAGAMRQTIRTHPGFVGSDFAGTYHSDLSIFWVGDPSNWSLDSVDSQGRALYPAATLWTGELGIGSELVVAGYGRRGTGSSPGTMASGTFAVGQNIYDAEGFGGRVGYFDFDSHDGTTVNLGSSTPHHYESTVNPGDSGGGWFSLSSEGKLALTHITSGIWGNLDGIADGSYGDIAMGVSVSYYHQWIQEQAYDILYTLDPYSYPVGEWATFDTVPEPSVYSLLFVAMGYFLWRFYTRKQTAN
jgi:hypothetical protein